MVVNRWVLPLLLSFPLVGFNAFGVGEAPAGVEAKATSSLPSRPPLERYAALWTKSPFSAATIVPDAASDPVWLLTSVTMIDNTAFVTLTNLQTKKSISLSPGESSGPVKLLHAESHPDSSKSFISVEINGTLKRLGFDEKQLGILSAQSSAKSIPMPMAAPQNLPAQPATINPGSSNSNRAPQVPRRRIIRPSSR